MVWASTSIAPLRKFGVHRSRRARAHPALHLDDELVAQPVRDG